MKKGILMAFVAIIMAAVGLVIAVMTALRREKKEENNDIYTDEMEFVNDDFDDAGEAAFAEDFASMEDSVPVVQNWEEGKQPESSLQEDKKEDADEK